MGTEIDHPKGIDGPAVEAWFEANVAGAAPPLRFELIPGGRSNLTYRVTDSEGRRFVLRRPPLGHVLATAHDMGREHRIISALADTEVPVPTTLGICTDTSVNEAPFYVMDFVEGVVLRDQATAEATYTPDQRRRISESLIEVMAAIHSVDLNSVGLADLGRHDGYIERQLKRWYDQFRKASPREVPTVDKVHDALAARVPVQGSATIVHGDYRLDNTMLGPDGDVCAVLDWEICTLGDPLADAGLFCVYWADPGDRLGVITGSPTVADGFARSNELMDLYAEVSGRDLSDIGFYTAFGYWKLACILEGVYARYEAGAMGEDGRELAALFADVVVQCADEAWRLIEECR